MKIFYLIFFMALSLLAAEEIPFLSFQDALLSIPGKAVTQDVGGGKVLYFPIFSFNAPILRRHKSSSAEEIPGDILLIVDDEVHMVSHYFHMMEHLIGIWNFLIHKDPEAVKKVILCFQNSSDDDRKWTGLSHDTSRLLMTSMFPEATVLLLRDLPQNLRWKAHNIHVSSRLRSHGIKGAGYVNMNGSAASFYHPERLRALRDHIFEKMGVQMRTRGDQLRITYIKRTTTRIMDPILEKKLLELISERSECILNVVDFSELSFVDQLQIVANTDLLMGVHGNGFTHLLFLPDDATVLEYYEGGESAFFRLFARWRGLRYYGNSHEHWEREINPSIQNKAPFQSNVTGVDLEGTLNLISQLL